MMDIKEQIHLENIDEPAKQWRNRWKSLIFSKSRKRPGEIYDGSKVHPSKEIAEQRALDELARITERAGFVTAEYLGAFPVVTK